MKISVEIPSCLPEAPQSPDLTKRSRKERTMSFGDSLSTEVTLLGSLSEDECTSLDGTPKSKRNLTKLPPSASGGIARAASYLRYRSKDHVVITEPVDTLDTSGSQTYYSNSRMEDIFCRSLNHCDEHSLPSLREQRATTAPLVICEQEEDDDDGPVLLSFNDVVVCGAHWYVARPPTVGKTDIDAVHVQKIMYNNFASSPSLLAASDHRLSGSRTV